MGWLAGLEDPDPEKEADVPQAQQEEEDDDDDSALDPLAAAKKAKQLARKGITFDAKEAKASWFPLVSAGAGTSALSCKCSCTHRHLFQGKHLSRHCQAACLQTCCCGGKLDSGGQLKVNTNADAAAAPAGVVTPLDRCIRGFQHSSRVAVRVSALRTLTAARTCRARRGVAGAQAAREGAVQAGGEAGVAAAGAEARPECRLQACTASWQCVPLLHWPLSWAQTPSKQRTSSGSHLTLWSGLSVGARTCSRGARRRAHSAKHSAFQGLRATEIMRPRHARGFHASSTAIRHSVK